MSARLRIVEDHIRFECRHEIDSLMGTFGPAPEWHNQAAKDVLRGHDAIRTFYAELFRGFSDFLLDVRQRHVCEQSVVVEGALRGTHTETWMGIPATGKTIAVPFCAIFTFTRDDLLSAEIVYYDRLSLLSQLGVIHLPA
jgi:steroid delta-isomerase-like uncharacterized protein